jgi:hypothetical protein
MSADDPVSVMLRSVEQRCADLQAQLERKRRALHALLAREERDTAVTLEAIAGEEYERRRQPALRVYDDRWRK